MIRAWPRRIWVLETSMEYTMKRKLLLIAGLAAGLAAPTWAQDLVLGLSHAKTQHQILGPGGSGQAGSQSGDQ